MAEVSMVSNADRIKAQEDAERFAMRVEAMMTELGKRVPGTSVALRVDMVTALIRAGKLW